MIGTMIVLGAMLASPTTVEIFTFGNSDLAGPCSVKLGEKPRGDPPAKCADSIEAARDAKDKAKLVFAWAYSLNEAGATRESLPWLDQALMLAPNFTNARHERAYTLNGLGFFSRALLDADRDVVTSPNSPHALTERAFARRRLADFEGSLADRGKAIQLEGSTAEAEIEVATDLMWLGRYDDAAALIASLPPKDNQKAIRADLDRRRHYKSDGKEAERCDMGYGAGEPDAAQRAVDACTWLFDHDLDKKRRAGYLTTRAVFGVVARQDRNSSIPDYQIAVALEPDNPQWHSNYGYALVGINHSWAGRNSLNDALSFKTIDQRTKAIALAGRGNANLNLGDIAAAKIDAIASFRVMPLEANVWLLGDVAKAEGDPAEAKKFWLEAYRRGARDDGLIESLKSVGVANPATEAK